MHRLCLTSRVFGAQLGDDLVLLDLSRGVYLCISRVALEGRDVCGAEECLQELAVAGLAARHPSPAQPAPRDATVPSASVAPAPGGALHPGWFAGRMVDAAAGYRRRTLSQLVDQAASGRASPEPRPTSNAILIARRSQALAPLLPLSAKCLLRSFLLLRQLRAAGEDALWVFGVRTWPFAAHCWLQAGEVVLDDDWERVRGYAPILTV